MLALERSGGVATIRLDRPERGNALGAELVERLIEAVAALGADATVHTLVLAGNGRHFCTGFDLADLDRCSDGDLLLRLVRVEALLAMLWHAPIRTACIAAGRTWGAGADLLAACDERVAVEGASLRFPGPAFGVVLGTGRLAERIGADRAREVVTQGLQLDAPAALAAGLVGRVLPAAAVPAWLDGLAPPLPDRDTVRALRAATRPDRRDADLAALVRSAARPGLQARLLAYREAQRAARA
jgi:enoyl-CoA hydratase/carnithine racemase